MNSILLIAIIVAVMLIVTFLLYVITKKIGFTFVNVALSLVNAIKTTLQSTSLASNKVTMILNLVIQALTYAQTVTDANVTMANKVETAYDYVKNLATSFGVIINDDEVVIIKGTLQIGFTLMNVLGLTASTKASYKKLYSRMAKYAGTSADIKAIGLKNIK